jgi:hypothetical protein
MCRKAERVGWRLYSDLLGGSQDICLSARPNTQIPRPLPPVDKGKGRPDANPQGAQG